MNHPNTEQASDRLTENDWLLLNEWAHNIHRKRPDLAFTSGVLRDAADAVWRALPTSPAQPTATAEQPTSGVDDVSDEQLRGEIRMIEIEHLCDCETCSRSNAICPASAGSLIQELAGLRIWKRRMNKESVNENRN